MRFSPHTAPRSILSKSLDPFQSNLNLFVWNLDSSTAFFLLIFFRPSFLKFHRFDPVESYPFYHWAKGTKSDWFFDQNMWNLRFFPLSLSLSSRYSVWINRKPFLLYLSLWIDIITFQFLPDTSQGKYRIGSQIDGLVWAYPCGYALFE